jgi:hypothetical protein
MARVRSFAPSVQRVRAHPTEVDCEFQVVGEGPRRLLHLSTFGSDLRETERKSSQSLQLDMHQARELVEIIQRAFPEIRRK